MPWALGIEGDIGDILSKTSKFDPNFPGGTFSSFRAGLYGDVTGRIGWTVSPQAMIYAKGGWAFFDGKAGVNNQKGGFGGGQAWTGDYNNGWTVGGGAEAMLDNMPGWSVKGEYQYFDFGTEIATLHTLLNGNFGYSNHLKVNMFTLGLNYRFGPR